MNDDDNPTNQVDDNEEKLLRSVTLQNARSIFQARQRAEAELVRTKEELERKTEELAHSLAMLRATLESTTDGILVTSGGGMVTDFNDKFVSMWRMSPEIMKLGDHALLLAATSESFAEPQQFLARIDEIYATAPTETYDLLQLADGRVFERFSRIQVVDNQMVGRVWSYRDITERKQTEEITRFLSDASAALAELTDYTSTLQKVAGLAVPFFADWCSVDMLGPDGRIQRLAVTHIDPTKVQMVLDLFRRYPPRPADRHGVASVLRTGATQWASIIPDAALEELAQDEEHLAVMRRLGLRSYICTPLRSRGRILGALTFVTAESGRLFDASDLSAAEDLANRAAIAMENAGLLEALKESDRRKDEFLAMLAHELRNPLAPIRNAVQIVRGKAAPVPELEWATDVIERQVHQMSRLVDDLLDVSRITTGRIELRRERVELASVLHSAIEASRPLIEKWGHELTVAIPEQPLVLDADPTRLAQVFLNLLNNAAKYMEREGRIWVTAVPEGDQISIGIRDTGIGIPEEMMPSIFEMFTQLDRSLDRADGGLGIGLTLVQRLVEMHGGTVRAHSAGAGMGSEFVVRLPLAVAAAGPGDVGIAEMTDAAAPEKHRILVVDDNRDAADSLAILLRRIGNDVQTAYDGLEAVQKAASFLPEMVLLDLGLPKMNGYEAARRIRTQPGGSNIILVALTGWGQDEDRRRTQDAGFDHHITKPVEFAALKELLAERMG